MLNNLRITLRFVIVLCLFWLSGAVVIGVSFWGLSSARDSLKTLHDEAMHRALMADQSIELTVQNRLQVLLAFQHAPGSHRGEPVQGRRTPEGYGERCHGQWRKKAVRHGTGPMQGVA